MRTTCERHGNDMGPKWDRHGTDMGLTSDDPEYPHNISMEENLNLECLTTNATSSQPIIDYNRYSTWKKLLRVTAYVFRASTFFKATQQQRQSDAIPNNLQAQDIRQAKDFVLKQSQLECFQDEILRLQQGRPIKANS